jgi:hypothetical protein
MYSAVIKTQYAPRPVKGLSLNLSIPALIHEKNLPKNDIVDCGFGLCEMVSAGRERGDLVSGK